MSVIQQLPHMTSSATGATGGTDLDVLDLFLPLVDRKYVIAIATAVGLLFAALAAAFTHSVYTAEAVIMPPQQGQSSAGLIGQLGGLAAISGLGGGSGVHDPNELYIGLLQSNEVQDAVIDRLNLKAAYHMPTDAYARLALGANSKFAIIKGGLISISVKDVDPRAAARIANTYVDALHSMNDHMAIGEASRRALFFGTELARQKNRLADAEAALQKTEQTTGAIAPGNQTALVIQQIAQMQGDIRGRELELESLRLSSTEQNPDVVRLNGEIAVLRSQLKKLQSGQSERKPGDILLTSQSLPEAQLTYSRKLRDVSYQNYLVELMARQYEAAKIDEAKAAPVIQLVDAAKPPEWKSGPHRTLWAIVGGALGFFISSLMAIGDHLLGYLLRDPVFTRRLAPFRRALQSGL